MRGGGKFLRGIRFLQRDVRLHLRHDDVRGVFGGELEKVLPTDPAAPLTAQHKADAAKQLARFAAVLEQVK